MPINLTEEEKRIRLQEMGLDPDVYAYKEDVEPVVAPNPISNGSALSALGTGAKRAIGGTIGGVGGAALGVLAAPATGGLSLAIPLIAGLGGGYLGGLAQEKLEPTLRGENELETQARQLKEQQLAEAHPIASFAGEVLPSTIAFRPSVSGLANLGKGLANVGRNTSIQLPAAQKVVIANALINSGVGAGTSVGMDLASGQDISIPRALGNAGVNMLLNEPTRIGKAIGFKATPIESDRGTLQTEIPLEEQPPIANALKLPPGYYDESATGIGAKMAQDIKRANDFRKAREEERGVIASELKADINVGAKPEPQMLEKPISANTLNISKESIERSMLENQVPRQVVKDLTDRTDNMSNMDRIARENESLPPDPYDDIEHKFQPTIAEARRRAIGKLPPLEEPPPNPESIQSKKTFSISQPEADLISREGVTAIAKDVVNPQGEGQAGVAKVGSANREINIDPINKRNDTVYHEVAHHRLQELLDDPKYSKLAKNLLNKFGGDEEALIQATGESYEARIKEFGAASGLRNFFKDFVAGVRGDAERILSSKLQYDAPFSERNGGVKVDAGSVVNKNQEATTNYSPESHAIAEKMPIGDIEKALAEVQQQIRDYPKFINGPDATDITRKAYLDDKAKLSLKAYNLSEAREILNSGNKYQPKENLYLEAPGILEDGNKLGTNPELKVNSSVLLNRLTNKLTPLEMDLLKSSGIESYINSNRQLSGKELSKWITDNGPKVEVHSYGMEGKVSEAKREYDRMTHEWYDNQRQVVRAQIQQSARTEKQLNTSILKQYIGDEDIALAQKYYDLQKKVYDEPVDNSPRATSAYDTVSALPTNEPMPEWTSSKSRKNVQRVDVVVPHGKVDERYNRWLKSTGKANTEESKIEFSHLPDNGGIKWQPDNLHENLPNTLGWAMIQYKTGSKGEKIAVIVEAQSRWGQSVRQAKQEQMGVEPRRANESIDEYRDRQQQEQFRAGRISTEHPLLKDYNRLILKAAIDQAKKEGATHIMVSDGETAMMTEGHDLAGVDTDGSLIGSYPTREQAYAAKERMDNATEHYHTEREYVIKQNGSKWEVHRNLSKIPQDSGMRLNYDKILPQIMKDLTGVSGEKVSLGEHKNAYDTREHAMRISHDDQVLDEGGVRTTQRKNLIFRNPDGTPKTDISGIMYPIDNTPEAFSLTRNKYQPKLTGIPEVDNIRPGIDSNVTPKSMVSRIASRFNPFNITKGLTERIADVQPINHPSLSDAFNKQRVGMREYEGQFRPIVESFAKLGKQDSELLHRVLLAENANGKSYRDSIKDSATLKAYDDIRSTLTRIVETQNNIGELVKEYIKQPDGTTKIEMRARKVNPYYFPNVISSDAVEVLSHPNSPQFKQLKEDLIEHYKKHYGDVEGAKLGNDAFNDFMENDGHGGDVVKFGPNRKAEGIGLPESWIENDVVNAMERYVRRTANDLSFYQNLESNPTIAKMIGIKTNQNGVAHPTKLPTGEDIIDMHRQPDVKNVMDIITGASYSKSPVLDAASGIANALLLGPVGGLVDIASIPFNAIKFAPSVFDVPGIVSKGLRDWKKGLEHSYENGINKHNVTSLRDLTTSTSRLAQKLNDARNAIYLIQGRKHAEQFARGLSQSMMEHAVEINVIRAKQGDKSAITFLKKLMGSDVDINNIDISKAGSTAAELLQGTYDFRNLPMWAIDSNIAPFFRLARWNIEQMNNFGKYVWEPATKGNFTPLIMSTLGALAGGALVKETRETFNDKKSYAPTLEEIVNSSKGVKGNLPLVAYKFMALASYVGYAGIASDMARSAMDVMLLHNKPQSIDFPLMGLIGDTTQRMMDAINSIREGEGDYLDVASTLAKDLVVNNTQIARLAQTWLLENTGAIPDLQRDKDRAEKFRDLRAFKQVEGLPVSPLDKIGNQYANRDLKEFKRTSDMKEAGSIAKGIREKGKESGNVVDAKRLYDNARRNQYATVPNRNSDPQLYAQYIQFIRKTQGEEAARKLIQDYNRQSNLNAVKRELIPQL